MLKVAFSVAISPPEFQNEDSWRSLCEWMAKQSDLITTVSQLIQIHSPNLSTKPTACQCQTINCWEFANTGDLEYFLLCLPPGVCYQIHE